MNEQISKKYANFVVEFDGHGKVEYVLSFAQKGM